MTLGGLQLGLHVPNFGEAGDLVALGVAAEASGWDGCFLWDHVAGIPELPVAIADPWVLLGALAARTGRIRLGTAVTPLARRRPSKLARETVTVDHLSGGRLVLGVGLGTPPQAEYATFGEPADRRVHAAKLDEALEVVTGLWSGEPFEHAGAYYTVTGTRFLPPPLQRPRIPIWVACSWPNRRPLTRAARWDGVLAVRELPDGNLGLVTPDDVAAIAAEVKALRAPGSGPVDLAVVNLGPPSGDEQARAYAEAGATWWLAAGWLDDVAALARRPPGG